MTQAQALSVMLSGKSVFLTGPPGAGKTYVLSSFIRRSKQAGKRIAVTASTGIAATHIGGTTIHSWSGLGIRDELRPGDLQALKNTKKLASRYNGTDILVIDEVSMLHGKRLDMLNEVAKIVRGSQEPFGGMQVILVGDLFQLPPVSRGTDMLDFAHTSSAWEDIDPVICYLHEQHRQQHDALLSLLEAMRSGDVTDAHEESLRDRLGKQPEEGALVTRLYAHNIDVDGVNQRHLNALTGESKIFEAKTKGVAMKVEQLASRILAPATLELKIGAEVMFVANDFVRQVANGSLGRVVTFRDGKPLVKLASTGRIIGVDPYTWVLEEDGHVRAEVSQLPLRLAWAMTIHKSQGMSLDAAEIDLGKAFTTGMGYVALSRVRSMDGVFLAGINAAALQMHPEIYEFDSKLQKLSSALAMTLPENPEIPEEVEIIADIHTSADSGLFDTLKNWRMERARAEQVPPYIIAHNAMLEQIAAHKPSNPQQLLAIKGFGDKKFENYGEDILKIVAQHVAQPAKVMSAASNQPMPMPDAAPVIIAETIASHQEPESFHPDDMSSLFEMEAFIPQDDEISEPPHVTTQQEVDAQLLALFRNGTSLEKACQMLNLTPAAAWARLATLLS